MPRTLPWLLEQNDAKHVKSESTPRERVKREPPDSDLTPRNPPASPDSKDFFRSSQTPPTSPARACPPEEFLIEGLDHDDAWVMVEDEFYAVAQSFTKHLHYAEYIRRKKEAKAQSAEAIRELERPTNGRTVILKELQWRKEAEALAARQEAGLEQIAGQEDKDADDDVEDVWTGTHLQEFITSPRKARSLVGARGLKSSTRAAAGFGQATGGGGGGGGRSRSASQSTLPSRSVNAPVFAVDEETGPEDDSEEAVDAQVLGIDQETASEDDDLDGHVQSTPVPPSGHGEASTPKKKPTASRRKTGYTLPTPKENSKSARASHQRANGFKSRVQSLFDDLDELPEPPQSSPPSKERQEPPSAERAPKAAPQKNNLESKNSRFHDVPTFLM